MFNPHGIPNTRLIYRTHALAPNPVVLANVPRGICVSLGFVINGVMKDEDEVQDEFDNPGFPPWFANIYYTPYAASDRAKIIEMIGGTQITY